MKLVRPQRQNPTLRTYLTEFLLLIFTIHMYIYITILIITYVLESYLKSKNEKERKKEVQKLKV